MAFLRYIEKRWMVMLPGMAFIPSSTTFSYVCLRKMMIFFLPVLCHILFWFFFSHVALFSYNKKNCFSVSSVYCCSWLNGLGPFAHVMGMIREKVAFISRLQKQFRSAKVNRAIKIGIINSAKIDRRKVVTIV